MNRLHELTTEKTMPFLLLIILCGILIRLLYFPYNIPIILDGSLYFWYAIDASLLGQLPTGYDFPNNGWPSFLSIFFSFLKSQNFLDFMNLQRISTVVISSLTAIPIYLLGTRFFEKKYAIIGAFIFIIDPRIIINSLLGVTDTSFILLAVLSLFFILGKDTRYSFIAFGLAALGALTRYEGILLLVPLSVSYFLRFRKENKLILKYFIAIGIFAIVLLPMTYERVQTMGKDGFISHISAATKAHQYISEYPESGSDYYNKTAIQTIKIFFNYLGWIMIPTFAFLVPIGIIIFFRKKLQKITDPRIVTIILFCIVMLLPASYAYSRGYQETRYLYIVFPILCLLSTITVRELIHKFTNQKLISIVICIGIIGASSVYLDIKGPDTDHERESFAIAQKISKVSKGINQFSEIEYIKSTYILNQNFPTIKKSVLESPKIITYSDEETVLEFVKKNQNNELTHIISDGLFGTNSKIERSLNDVFLHEEKYPYLKKVYDSSQDRYHYRVKVFEIDYKVLS